GAPGTEPLAGVALWGAARRDPFWNGLRLSAGNEDDSGRLGATARAGQMIRTPSFVLEGGRLHYLVRGKGRVYASVDSHLMNEGPLHGVLTQKFDTGGSAEPRWVTHDLAAYSGHRTHIEFGPDGESPLEILRVEERAEAPSWSGWVAPEVSVSATDAAARAAALVAQAVDWLTARAHGAEVPLPGPGVLRAADWLLKHPVLLGASDDGAYRSAREQWARTEAALAAEVLWSSATALAWFDGTGVDEHVLVRGKPTKPGPVAPRSLPAAFADARPIAATATSGRLELAAQLTAPENPLVARVLVNRVWHHLFGRGLVPTVDNFGALGESPTHPELLDHLAWSFVSEDRWSLKRLVQRLVLTQAYSMGSRPADPEALERDPANRWWHSIPVRPLEAESLRSAESRVGRSSGTGPPDRVHGRAGTSGQERPARWRRPAQPVSGGASQLSADDPPGLRCPDSLQHRGAAQCHQCARPGPGPDE
ncbi:MAG: DUF1553 domain-containing protein, partial [Verrucomicrobia bacterium]|nr:DUF1553 domain-containing protein [Verrucomicrobiota bacterium]